MLSFVVFLLLPFRYLFDFFFPHCCLFCQRPYTPLCDNCVEQLDFCTQLEAEIFYPDLSVRAVCIFDRNAQKIIHTYKYRGIPDLGPRLAELFFTHILLPDVDLVTAIPPDPKRKKQRGFDHTARIAKRIAELLGIPYVPTLTKTKSTKSQASTHSKLDRKQHLNNLFELLPASADLSNQRVLLIDDVCTTGSTLRECKRILEGAGAIVHPTVFCIRI